MALRFCEFCKKAIRGLGEIGDIEKSPKVTKSTGSGKQSVKQLVFAHLRCFSENTTRRKENEIKLKY